MLLSCLSTPLGSFFSYWIKFRFLSLTQPFRDQPDLNSHCYLPPFFLTNLMVWATQLFIFAPTKMSDPFVGPMYLHMLFPFAWQIHFQTQVFLLKPSLLHLMHTYWYALSLFPWYFTHISVKSSYYTIPIYVTTANILCALTMCHVLC